MPLIFLAGKKMNKRQILASLNNIANSLDNSGLYKEAETLSLVMIKVAQVAQPQQMQQPQQSGNIQQLLNEARRIEDEFSHYKDKFMSLFRETVRKIDAGIPMQETNGVLNATIMMNQMIAYLQPLADKEKNLYAQLGYPTHYNEVTQRLLNSMRQYSNFINNKYTSKKRT